MTMMKLVSGHWTTWLIAATLALTAACKSPKAEDTTVAADTVTKASTSPRRDSVRADSSAVATGHTVLFVGTSLTAGLGLNPDSAYPQLIQEKIESAHLPFATVNAEIGRASCRERGRNA